MPKCNCYSCRNYFDGCEEKAHPKRIKAKHLNGHFYWGKGTPNDVAGNWVMICEGCRDELAQHGND